MDEPWLTQYSVVFHSLPTEWFGVKRCASDSFCEARPLSNPMAFSLHSFLRGFLIWASAARAFPAPLLHLSCTSPDLSCTFPDLSCTSPDLLRLSSLPLCCTSPARLPAAPLLKFSCTSPAPLLHLSCTPPDPCCTSLPCTSPAEVRRLSDRHFKPFQNQCEAMQSFLYVFYINLSGVVTCWACMAPLLTSPAPLLHPSCTSPHLSAPLLRFSDLSCTFPDPCCTSLPCTSPAEVRRLSERHFKPFQNKCEAMQSFYMFFI